MRIVKLINLIALLCSVAWFSMTPDWEPAITSLGLLISLISIDIRDYSPRASENDKRLFKKLKEELPPRCIDFISKHDFKAAYFSEETKALLHFCTPWENADHEFNDKKLEKLRKQLMEKIDEFTDCLGQNTFTLENRSDVVSVPKDWEFTKPELHSQVVSQLNNSGDEIAVIYQELTRRAKHKLGITTD